jgi:hypothetical protein
MPNPRVVIVTNGNYFANLGLSRVFAATAGDVDYRVVVTTGLRRAGGNRLVEAGRLFRRWGTRYSAYKLATYLLPGLVGTVRRQPLSVAATCRQSGIPVLRTRSINVDPGLAWVRAHQPDLLVSFSCPYRVEQHVLNLPSVGALNVHGSLLPEYAGVCTYVHVLADGQTTTGVTVHEMVERFDAGRIVASAIVPIEAPTSVFALFAEQCWNAGELLATAIKECLAEGRISGVPQDLSKRSYCGEPTRSDILALRAHGHRLIRPSDAVRVLKAVS